MSWSKCCIMINLHYICNVFMMHLNSFVIIFNELQWFPTHSNCKFIVLDWSWVFYNKIDTHCWTLNLQFLLLKFWSGVCSVLESVEMIVQLIAFKYGNWHIWAKIQSKDISELSLDAIYNQHNIETIKIQLCWCLSPFLTIRTTNWLCCNIGTLLKCHFQPYISN